MSEERKTQESEPEHLCNLCGLTCSLGVSPHIDRRGGLIEATISGGYESTPGNGYGALDDMTWYKFSLCEFCLDWLFSQFKIPVSTGEPGTLAEVVPPWKPAAERVAEDKWRKWKTEFTFEALQRAMVRSVPKVAK